MLKPVKKTNLMTLDMLEMMYHMYFANNKKKIICWEYQKIEKGRGQQWHCFKQLITCVIKS